VIHAHGVAAQHPVSTPGQPPQSAGPAQLPFYRPPALALVQPAAGGSVPEDKPFVVFRFAQGEPNDPIDIRSFIVTVNGEERSTLFQVTSSEAWGPLVPRESSGRAALSTGAHQVIARICSIRGACSETSATVAVTLAPNPIEDGADRKRSLLNVLLDVARKLLKP
jgi:hypothetical protein